ncbi:unnamed protein product [Parnassius apollo]|uniref:(apollo) hypothetical protein n=1 Tax=Parnassius apollo TaxID=110799 RepID=A0A8S3WET9_PARAO|nr:unnamed protein product [Parnassius apollo]
MLDKHKSILTLREQQCSSERVEPRRGRAPVAAHVAHAHHNLVLDSLFPHEDEARKILRSQRRGATLALTSLTKHFGNELPQKLNY